MPDEPLDNTRRNFLAGAGVTLLGLSLFGAAAKREAETFEVSHHHRTLDGLRAPLHLSVLTDFHVGPFIDEERLAQWVEASNALVPDAVFIVGDLVDRHYRGDLSEFARQLPQLRSPLGTFVVPGNHDYRRYRKLQPLKRVVEEAGARFMLNEGHRLRDDVYLAGVDDVLEGRPDVDKALANAPTDGQARILLSHNPDIIPELPEGLGLVLAGHTHGGQVCIPGYGAVFTASEYGRRFASGWVRADMPAFVSRGLGVTAVPLRFACRAEVVSLELVPG